MVKNENTKNILDAAQYIKDLKQGFPAKTDKRSILENQLKNDILRIEAQQKLLKHKLTQLKCMDQQLQAEYSGYLDHLKNIKMRFKLENLYKRFGQLKKRTQKFMIEVKG